jgi:hypothetical protein
MCLFALGWADASKQFESGNVLSGLLLLIPGINLIVDIILRASSSDPAPPPQPLHGRITHPSSSSGQQTKKAKTLAKRTLGHNSSGSADAQVRRRARKKQDELVPLPPPPKTRSRTRAAAQPQIPVGVTSSGQRKPDALAAPLIPLPETSPHAGAAPQAQIPAATRRYYANLVPPARHIQEPVETIEALSAWLQVTVQYHPPHRDDIFSHMLVHGGNRLSIATLEAIIRRACQQPGQEDQRDSLLELLHDPVRFNAIRYQTHWSTIEKLLTNDDYNNGGGGDCCIYSCLTARNIAEGKEPYHLSGDETTLRPLRRHHTGKDGTRFHTLHPTQESLSKQHRYRRRIKDVFHKKVQDAQEHEFREQFIYCLENDALGTPHIRIRLEDWEKPFFYRYGNDFARLREDPAFLAHMYGRDGEAEAHAAQIAAFEQKVTDLITAYETQLCPPLSPREAGYENYALNNRKRHTYRCEFNQFEINYLLPDVFQRAIIILDYIIMREGGLGWPQFNHLSINGARYLPSPENLFDDPERLPLVITHLPGHYITPNRPFGLPPV